MRQLDVFDGYPKVYRRMWLEVEVEGKHYMALTYEMTAETKRDRNGKPNPEEYLQICSAGARFHHIKN